MTYKLFISTSPYENAKLCYTTNLLLWINHLQPSVGYLLIPTHTKTHTPVLLPAGSSRRPGASVLDWGQLQWLTALLVIFECNRLDRMKDCAAGAVSNRTLPYFNEVSDSILHLHSVSCSLLVSLSFQKILQLCWRVERDRETWETSCIMHTCPAQQSLFLTSGIYEALS